MTFACPLGALGLIVVLSFGDGPQMILACIDEFTVSLGIAFVVLVDDGIAIVNIAGHSVILILLIVRLAAVSGIRAGGLAQPEGAVLNFGYSNYALRNTTYENICGSLSYVHRDLDLRSFGDRSGAGAGFVFGKTAEAGGRSRSNNGRRQRQAGRRAVRYRDRE